MATETAEGVYARAVDAFLGGRLADADALLRAVLHSQHTHADAWHLLGLVALRAGELDTAAEFIEAAIECRPHTAMYHHNLGDVERSRGDLSAAAAAFRTAIQLEAAYPSAHNGLGAVLGAQRRYAEAAAHYRKALQLDPRYADAARNLGNALTRQGRLEEALARYEQALKIEPASMVRHDIAVTLFGLRRFDALLAFVARDPDAEGVGDVLHAIVEFERGVPAACRGALDAAEARLPSSGDFPGRARYTTYLGYLRALLAKRAAHPQLYEGSVAGVLYVVGDSHSLATAGLVIDVAGARLRAEPRLAIDVTAWALGRSEPNEYQRRFAEALASVPDDAQVLVTAGEIDCRFDAGILPHQRRHPEEPLADAVRALVRAYVERTCEQARSRGIVLTFAGVPAPNGDRDAAPAEEQARFLEVRRTFNTALAQEARSHGCRFVDLDAVTAQPDGWARPERFVDAYHCEPSAFAEAIREAR